MVSHNEREIGIDTPVIEPLTDYLMGTVLLMDIFTENGIQWLLYRNKGRGTGFLSQEVSPTEQAISTLYRHVFVMKKPVWKYRVGNGFTKQELTLLREIYRVSKFDWPFTRSLEYLSDKFPIRDYHDKPVDQQTYVRRHMAPKMVKLLNSYFANRPMEQVDPAMVKTIINQCIDMMGFGNNITTYIKQALDESGLYHQTTEAVAWGGILKSIMDGDVDDILETIDFFEERDKRTRDRWDQDTSDNMRKYRIHSGTDFGRGASANW